MESRNEIWKDIKGWEGYYQVSNLGNVRSLDRAITQSNGKVVVWKGRLLRQRKNELGYKFVGLRKDYKRKTMRVHRLVAMAFIPNPNNLPQINHKDVNPSNNRVDNLEWCSQLYNNMYDNANIKRGISRKENYTGTPVLMFSKDGKLLRKFDGLRYAEEFVGCGRTGHISDCANGKRKTAYGYIWRYESQY